MNLIKAIELIAGRSRNTFINELDNEFPNRCKEKNWYNKIDPRHTTTLSDTENKFISSKICEFVINIVSIVSFVLTKRQKQKLLSRISKELK